MTFDRYTGTIFMSDHDYVVCRMVTLGSGKEYQEIQFAVKNTWDLLERLPYATRFERPECETQVVNWWVD